MFGARSGSHIGALSQQPAGRCGRCGRACASWQPFAGGSAIGGSTSCWTREGIVMNHKKLRRLYREERLQVRRRGGASGRWARGRRWRCRRAPISAGAWTSCPMRFADGRRFRILAIVDDFTRECLALVADTSLSGLRVVRELDALIARARPAGDVRLRQRHRADQHGDPALVAGDSGSNGTTSRPASRSRTPSSRASTAGCATSCLNETLFTSLNHAARVLADLERRLQHGQTAQRPRQSAASHLCQTQRSRNATGRGACAI